MTRAFGGGMFFQSTTLIGPARQVLDHLPQDARALPHLFQPNEVAIVAVARRSDDHFEIVVLVIEIGMFAPQIVFDSAAAQIRPGKSVGDGAVSWDDADVLRAIDENAIARQELSISSSCGMNSSRNFRSCGIKVSGRSRICPPTRV